jgi:hypothetical protein
MTRFRTPSAIANGLATVFTGMWYLILGASALVAIAVLWGGDIGVHIGPNGQPDFEAGSKVSMVLPVAFELDATSAEATLRDDGRRATLEQARGMLRFPAIGRPWPAMAGAAAMVALALWILAELAALCRSVRDGHPFIPINAVRIRRHALAVVLAEVWRAAMAYAMQAWVAAHFTADHLRFTAWPSFDAVAIVSALILLVLAEVFRIGTRLDEEQSLTV